MINGGMKGVQVRKRNGKIEEFDITKIAVAIYRTRLDANQEKSLTQCINEAKEVIADMKPEDTVDIEKIQDAIERYFIRKDELDIFKMFTFFREMRRQDRLNPWANNDERQDLILQKYLIPGETKAAFLNRVSLGDAKLLKIFRNREGI